MSDMMEKILPSWIRPFIEEPAPETGDSKQALPYAAIALGGISVVGLGVQIGTSLFVTAGIAPAVLWGLALLLTALTCPRTAPKLTLLLLISIFVIELGYIAQEQDFGANQIPDVLTIVSGLASLLGMGIIFNMPLRHPVMPRDDISKPYTEPTNQLRSPEDNLTLLQWMTVSWMGSLVQVGTKRQIQADDVWKLGYEFQHHHLHNKFRDTKGSVIWRLVKANWVDMAVMTFTALVELSANYSAPLLLQKLLQSMEIVNTDKKPAITFALLILVVRLISAQSGVFSLWFGRRSYERSRGEMITMLFEKTLHRKIIGLVEKKNELPDKQDLAPGIDVEAPAQVPVDGAEIEEGENHALLNGTTKPPATLANRVLGFFQSFRKVRQLWPFKRSSAAKKDETKPASMGKILNLMRGDCYEVAQRFWEIQILINKPIGLILSIVLVWRLIGWSCLLGVAVILVAQVMNVILARILVHYETVRRKATDGKLQQITQYVEAIRHLRWYGWHPVWLERVIEARQKELNSKIVTNTWSLVISFVNGVSSSLLPVVSYLAFTTVAKQPLRVDIVFPAMQLFGLLQSNIKEIPRLITTLLNATVAVNRLNEFMAEPDKEEDETAGLQFGQELETKNASFAWPGTAENVLHDLSLTFPSGLTLLYGPVASGKSALLQALLGELDLRNGELVRPNTPVAYCSQTPWLQSMTIRDNILFGSPYDEVRYKQTLEACALTTDLASFERGDLSAIGENGIGLSGGQKARTALARAVYSRADTLLLDDPLSALDQQTAEHIVRKCLRGPLLRGRTVILATHRVDLCHDIAEQAIELAGGHATVTEGQNAIANGAALSPVASRQNTASQTADKLATEAAAVPDKFEDEEHRAHGGVQLSVYGEYIKAGGLGWWVLVILFAGTCRLLIVADSWFLKEWSEAYATKEQNSVWVFSQLQQTVSVAAASPISRLFDSLPDPGLNPKPWLVGLFLLGFGQDVTGIISQIFMLVVTYIAGKNMFKEIMVKVSNAQFRFYDVTPVGRLMNRLTSDVGTIDGNISYQFLNVSWQVLAWISSVIVIASVAPLFLIFALVLTFAFVFIFMRFLPASQSLRRLEMVSLSPLMSNFGALLEGLTTVRAFCAQSQFQDRVIEVTDDFQKMDHFYWSLQAWLMYRFDILSACSTLVLTLLAIYSGLSPGLTAFVLIAAGRFVIATHALCRVYGQVQLDFVSVERVVELTHLEQEQGGSIEPPASWPTTRDDIVFENVTIRYAPHLEPAIRNVSFTLPGGSNTAVIGRTGSGKSTMAVALLATVTPTIGRILIGGIDIAKVDKNTLRTRVTFLAQDPVLFPGSLRHNLDPTNEHTDDACAAVLERVCGAYDFSLTTEVDTGGKNLSQGQRQLVGLARAILRRSSIVIMDEATASIDKATAWEIQRVLREEMKGSTVVTIAHRPSAVRGAELCVQLADGELVKIGKPDEVVPGDSNGSEAEDAI